MNSRSKKYLESRKADKSDKKALATKVAYDEQNEKTIKQLKKNPTPQKNKINPFQRMFLQHRMIQVEEMIPVKGLMITDFKLRTSKALVF